MTGIVLAGGHGRRLHRAKCTLLVGGEPLIARVIAQVRPVVDRVTISASLIGPYQAYGLPVVADEYPGRGPLAGMHAAMTSHPDADYLVLAGDMPFVSRRILDRLLTEWTKADAEALVPLDAEGRPQPLQAIYAHCCAATIEQQVHAGQHRVTALLDAVRTRYLDVGPMAGCSFFNVNTPEALQRAQEIAARLSDTGQASEDG